MPEDEYLIRDVTVSPRSVELTGPAEEIERISQCIVEEEINEELTSSYTTTLFFSLPPAHPPDHQLHPGLPYGPSGTALQLHRLWALH